MNKNDIFIMRFGDFILILYPSLQESIYTVQSYFLPWQNDINLEQNGISNGYQIRCDNVAIHLNLCKWLRLKKLLLLYFKDAVDTRLLMVETWILCFMFAGFHNLTEGMEECAAIQSRIISITSAEQSEFLNRLAGNVLLFYILY